MNSEESVFEPAARVMTRHLINTLDIIERISPERFGEAYVQAFDALEKERVRLGFVWNENKVERAYSETEP